MKKALLLLLVLNCHLVYPQYNVSAPWNNNDNFSKSGPKTIDDLVNQFNQYWLTRDNTIKGCGFKPFMRWENHWRNLTNSQGLLITPQQMWDAYYQKKALTYNKSNASLLAPASNWEPVGPFTHTNTGSWSSGQGRVNIVYQDPSNSNTIYIGTPAGGIWKSINSGLNWLPLSDNLPQIGVSGIAVDPNNSNIIYIATGDCDASDTYSVGVMKSVNGGATWNTTGLIFNTTDKFSGDILINPNNSNMLWVATTDGIYRTINGGNDWDLVETDNFSQGRLRLKPGDPNTVYAVSYDRFYRSTNSGASFTNITNGLPASSGRLIMDVTPANANYIYILSASTSRTMQGIYRSVNGGTTWTQTSGSVSTFDGSKQSWYDLALAVSTTNANEIYTGCLNIWQSLDGGGSFSKLNNWDEPYSPAYTHADIHYLKFFGNKLYCGSDGGVFVSQDNGSSFTDLTATAQIGQFYKIAVSKQTASKMVGGLQDNGGHALSDNLWKNYYGADGMDTAIDPNNSNIYYGFIQFGGGLYISNNAGNSLSEGIDAPTAETGTNDQGGNWITPLVSNNAGELFAGYSNLYKLTNGAWIQQSTGSFGSGNIELVAIDPSNDNIMYVVNEASLYKSINKGINFNLVYSASVNIASIDVHSSNSNILYLTTKGIDGEALKSTDGGNTFISFSEGLPNIGKNVIVHQGRNSNNPLFLGTNLGVYYRDDTLSQWEPFDTNLPNVEVTDLEINLEDAKLVAATYGRGIWQTAIPFIVPSFDIKLSEIQNPTSINVNCSNSVIPQVLIKNVGLNNINNATFNYNIDATPYVYNWSGTIIPNQTALVNLPQATLNRGAYNLVVNTTIPNDAYNDNNSGSTNFYLNDSGTVNLTNTFENVSNELLEFNEGSNAGQWIRGIRTGGNLSTGTNNVYATSLSGNYPNSKKAYLISQCYNLAQVVNPQISFKMAFDLEVNYDIVYVEYTTDFGQNWFVLGQEGVNWYNSSRTSDNGAGDCNNCVGAQWTGTDTTFKTYSYSLASLGAPTNIIFRIVFHSDPGLAQQGVIVDNFLIDGTLSNETFELNKIVIYPNPSNGLYTIFSSNLTLDELEVFDVTGKTIVKKHNIQINNNSALLNLSNISSGIYFVRITSNNQSTVKRIIKN